MSRSRKKNPFYELVAHKNSSKRAIKKLAKRRARRTMKQRGLLEENSSITSFKRESDLSFEYDLFTKYAHNKDKDKDWYIKMLRK